MGTALVLSPGNGMNIKRAAEMAGVTHKALKYYEAIGLITPRRSTNGYRTYGEHEIELVRQIKELTAVGLSVKGTKPFIECLQQGHVHGDDCPESLAAYHGEIRRLDALVEELSSRREMLRARLHAAAARGFTFKDAERGPIAPPRYGLPKNLPAPVDDGSASHLGGLRLPNLSLRSTDGRDVNLRAVGDRRWVLFVYPTTGIPGEDMPIGWEQIPGARGCTAEACGFRDSFGDLLHAGLEEVYGLSVQESRYQRELAQRLHLPYPLLSDPSLALRKAVRLPIFEADGRRFYKRLTMIVHGQRIEHVFFPIFPPNEHAREVLDWLRGHPAVSAAS
jgi:peroxiredoxin/DNA-binding transcriptional MerR regulator